MPADSTPTGSRAQRIAAELETKILGEHTPPGTRLGLRTDLMKQFAVSSPVLNEALRILRERDLISVKPGVNGGIFVANPPPHVQLGGIDLWYQGLTVDPEQLFEARAYLDGLFPVVAMQRAGPEDMQAMEWALHEMHASAGDPRALLDANMRLHLAIARASRIDILVGMYQTIVSLLTAGLTRAAYIEGHEDLVHHNLDVHASLIAAIRDRDQVVLDKALTLHREDMVRIDAEHGP